MGGSRPQRSKRERARNRAVLIFGVIESRPEPERCGGPYPKVRFPSRKWAEEALRQSLDEQRCAKKRHSRTRRRELRVYRCPACQGWHLTSTEWRPPATAPQPAPWSTLELSETAAA